MTQFKVGDVVQVATMDDLAGETENWAKMDGLKLGIDYTISGICSTNWVRVSPAGRLDYLHRQSRFKLKTNTMELKVTKEKVLEAASKCSQAKETLKTLFPEAFGDGKERFEFPDNISLRDVNYETPFFVGRGFAPSELSGMCLVVHDNWDIEVFEHEGRKIIAPFKK